ncbi:MAG: polyphosphate kinase 1 [Clostridiales bacterium]|nr:polyphosphate kinase 1 [Clostridiales bacterium]
MTDIYINREISWLKFDKRVLLQSLADEVPLFERLKFIEIFGSNLDEFFMVRVGSMLDRSLIPDEPPDNKTGMTPAQQLAAIYADVRPLYALRDECWRRATEKLSGIGIHFLSASDLGGETAKLARQYFKREVLPFVTPQIIDVKHPMAALENKRMYLAVTLRPKRGGKASTGIVPVSNAFGRVVPLPAADGMAYLPIEDLLLRFASDIFKGWDIAGRAVVRVTRNADVEVEDNFSDDDLDYRDYVTAIIKRREKLSPVRIETYSASYSGADKLGRSVAERCGLGAEQYFASSSPLELKYIYGLEDKIKARFGAESRLFYSPLSPRDQKDIPADRTIEQIASERDIFLSYPYYSMKPYLRMLEEASEDGRTVSIKITLYRMASNSQVVDLLCRAAQNGIEVTALVELKARFDETNNISWSRRLEEAGCHVIYGLDQLKVHSKITMITRRSDGETGVSRLVHIATGNYNEKTAKLYTDVGVITTDERITGDADRFFGHIAMGEPGDDYRYLLVSPNTLKKGILREIESETALGPSGYICIKMNSLTDKDVIDALAAAGRRGVKVELIIRGICCLRPGIIGETDNIRVVSIVGRYLEHSRIFIFGNGRNVMQRVYIGSADMMTRNTTRRVEIITPIYDKDIAARLVGLTQTALADNVKKSVLMSSGSYEKPIDARTPLNSQEYLYAEAYRETGSAE